jgi:hypothetical protein
MPWMCPKCRKKFKHANQSHSCARVDLAEHFKNKSPLVKATFDRLMTELSKLSNITVNPVKSSIQVKGKTTFLSIKPTRDYLGIEFLLDAEVDEFPVYKTFRYSKTRIAHFTALEEPRSVTKKLMKLLTRSHMLGNK